MSVRYAPQIRLTIAAVAIVLFTAACAQAPNSGSTHTSHQNSATANNTVAVQVSSPAPVNTAAQSRILRATNAYLANPKQASSLDASGFIQTVYQTAKISLPRTVAAQAATGIKVTATADLIPADLVFFHATPNAPTVTFVGIYLGNNEVAARTTHGVMTFALDNSYWGPRFAFGTDNFGH